MIKARRIQPSKSAAITLVAASLALGLSGCMASPSSSGGDEATQPSDPTAVTEAPSEMSQDAFQELVSKLSAIDGVIGVALAADGKIVVRTTEEEPADGSAAQDALTKMAEQNENIVIEYDSKPLSAL